jgi:hypothetical protein
MHQRSQLENIIYIQRFAMRSVQKFLLLLVTVSTLLSITSCKNLTGDSGNISQSLEPVENVIPLEGAERSSITVNKGTESYFRLGFSGMGSNDVIANGFEGEGWCIDWQKPIESNGATYSDIQLYSTYNVEKWNPLNFFFNIMDDLKQADSDLTYREFQAVVWSLRGLPEFNLEALTDEELPSRLKSDGQANFSREKVATIIDIVEAGYEDFDFTEGTRFAVIAETPSDVQTVITVVD